MEVGVELLRLILVVVDSKFVMISRLVLPLNLGLDSKQLHEVVKFYVVVLFTELLTLMEEPITLNCWLNNILRRPLFFITCLVTIVTIVCFSFVAFLVFIAIVIIITSFRSIVLFLFLLDIGVAFSYDSCLGGTSTIVRHIFDSFNGSKCVKLRMRLFGIPV